ncbi:MAG: hypothetical protein IKN87_04815 [Bacilli bacterium]|nr:hypothetical protein [Bacilli bacterium]
MKKMPLLIVGLYIALFCFKINVNAADCAYGLQAPQIPQGYAYNSGDLVHLHTSYSACKGVNTAVYFGGFGSLPNWFEPTPNTVVHGDLMEWDPQEYAPNETVKHYYGTFTGRTLTNFYLSSTVTPGNIDSEGDQTCELYMDFSISGFNGGTPIPQGLFYYGICMN